MTAAFWSHAGWAADDAASVDGRGVEDLRNLSIEDLANLKVTSVAKRSEAVSEAPASIFVITADDIRRSGATSLPEALRLAPNLEVARLNANSYAITARGMNSMESSNKLLVLIDGRSVYEPIASGVLWQQVDVPLADIDRIEVISGPGGTLWGANAVNGVINVITRSAADTKGVKLVAGAGDFERDASLHLGVRLSDNASLRIYGQAFDRSDLPRAASDTSNSGFKGSQGGFRLDGSWGSNSYTLQGDAYRNILADHVGSLWGGDILARWNRALADGSSAEVQAYYAKDDRTGPDTYETRDSVDIQAQHTMVPRGQHQVVWGGEYHFWRENFVSTNFFRFLQPKTDISLGALFVQDEIAVRPDLKLTLGLKVEDNNYSGVDWMPNVRLAWSADPRTLWWAAVSRAVRTPNRIERELTAAGFLAPSPDFQSEKLWAFEAGYRSQLSDRLLTSVSVFYNVYDDLRTDELTAGGLPIVLRNGAGGATYGVEAWGQYAVSDRWRLKAGFNTLQKDIRLKTGHTDISLLQIAGMDPKYQAQLRSELNLTDDIETDLALRRVGRVDRPMIGPAVPAYTELDARLGWRLKPGMEVAVNGYNLLNPKHLELNDQSTAPLRWIPRSVFVSLRLGF